MIFVTVGTHEQQFDRLLKEIDRLKMVGVIDEEVFMQIGYSDYEPQHCKWKRLLPYSEMGEMLEQARIIITHGGPASFMAALQIGKIPIVVPRQKQYQEHVNDHQLSFARAVSERMGTIIPVYDIERLEQIISGYDEYVGTMTGSSNQNNKKFCQDLENIVKEMFAK